MSSENLSDRCALATEELAEVERLLELFKSAKKRAIEMGEPLVAASASIALARAIEMLEAKVTVSVSRAEKVFGEYFLGPKEIEGCFRIKLEKIPPIQFKKADLERARALGQMLILQIDRDANGDPLTIERMRTILPTVRGSGATPRLAIQDWYLNENFFKNEVPDLGWRLVSHECIPRSKGEDYEYQTEMMIRYIKTKLFDTRLPQVYEDAITQFEQYQRSRPWGPHVTYQRRMAAEFEQLSITKLTRETAIEAVYRKVLGQHQRGPNWFTDEGWTRSSTSDSAFVEVEVVNQAIRIFAGIVESAGENRGVIFSRRV